MEYKLTSVKYTHSEKICNRCGEYTKLYIVFNNAPICRDCAEILKFNIQKEVNIKKQLILSEATMIKKLLEKGQKNLEG